MDHHRAEDHLDQTAVEMVTAHRMEEDLEEVTQEEEIKVA